MVLQRTLASKVITKGRIPTLAYAAGADVAFSRDDNECIAGVVLWDVSAGSVVEQHVLRRPLRFPYVPGLLSFREAPAILAALRKLRTEPDVFLFDGQGLAHPRRFGLACHLGVVLDRPSVGCAKSLLVGQTAPVGVQRGSAEPIYHNGERVGTALRTRERVRPVYVSVGHRISLETAVQVTLACGGGFRLPEPTRRADHLVALERARL